MALKYQEASKLQKLAFLPNIWQFTIDLSFMQKEYGLLQLLGFGLLFGFYIVELLRFFCSIRSQKKEREENATEDGDYKRAV
jgi:hypothetical protein